MINNLVWPHSSFRTARRAISDTQSTSLRTVVHDGPPSFTTQELRRHVCMEKRNTLGLPICCQMSGALTDGGQGRWAEAKAIITTVGTRFNMPYLAMLTDVAKEPGQELIVANRRAIAHKCDMPPCPGNGHVHAPVVAKEPYRSQGVRPNH